jgi:hypothetical protein
MAKKMQRLDESPDFRPFKFRIQAFTNAFLEEVCRWISLAISVRPDVSCTALSPRLPRGGSPDEEGMHLLLRPDPRLTLGARSGTICGITSTSRGTTKTGRRRRAKGTTSGASTPGSSRMAAGRSARFIGGLLGRHPRPRTSAFGGRGRPASGTHRTRGQTCLCTTRRPGCLHGSRGPTTSWPAHLRQTRRVATSL